MRRLNILKWCADEKEVGSIAYFVEGTNPALLERAARLLGADNVRTFTG
ncbi:hypothetical protein JOF53_000834 [Crossiella equi]|uniref:Uncharacterized protein n=1 Tax=Crossiella equi TaxID=130796 RepID=A0ABS5A6V6_9PSEU|nr:hypothetical protein [Crossiella equi]MBP2471962.1 hypothetical protein [Crossiella equi]